MGRSLNSTLVQFKQRRIKNEKEILLYVSIPLWFNSNEDINISLENDTLIVSIPLWFNSNPSKRYPGILC